ncbi:MAG: TonB-dependent receptor [Phyllobacteriaceae bacterium]|nr:TonB-dependent receptor [Phyllobacteriaceae bacterium]MBA90314.1 TonB-dependent receptor [Phyllobacteriaceae bacterium]
MGILASRSGVLLASAGVFGLLAAGPAWTQDDAGGAAAKQGRVTLLQRLVVGAGQDKVAIDTPQAVTVIEQEDIEKTQPTTVGDVIRQIPGVNVSGSDRVLGQSFNIRGIGAPEQAGEEGRIIVKVDGVDKFYEQYRMGGFFSDPELYKRVEVLRGPASSTLYGSGALGGVVNFTTKDASDFITPGERGALRLKSAYDSNGDGWLGSVILAQKLTERTDLLFAGNYRTADNYETGNGTQVRSSFFDTWSGLAKVTSQVADEGRLEFSWQRWDSDADGQDLVQVGTDTLIGGVPMFGLVDRHVTDDTFRVAWSDPVSGNDWLDFRIQASYSSTRNEQRNATGNPMFGLSCATSQLFCDTDYAYNTFQFDVENTSEWHGETWENFLTHGWQFARQERVADVLTGTPGIGFHPEGTDLRNGFFVQNEFVWNEKLTLIPGVRFDFRSLAPGASTGVTGRFTDTAVSPKIAAHYRFNENVAIFGSFAHTERFPTLDEVFSTTSSRYVFQPSFGLRKERSDNWEAGIALSGYDLAAPGDSLQLKTTVFHNSIKDLITLNPALTPGFNPRPGFVNVANARIYGAELELSYDSDYFFASAAYTHTVGKDLTNGWDLTTVAPHELALTVGGRIPDRALEFGWRSRFVADPADACRVANAAVICAGGASSRFSQSFNVHDAYVAWTPQEGRWAGLEAHFAVENIFNEQYKEFLSNDLARGRTFKVALTRKFGW